MSQYSVNSTTRVPTRFTVITRLMPSTRLLIMLFTARLDFNSLVTASALNRPSSWSTLIMILMLGNRINAAINQTSTMRMAMAWGVIFCFLPCVFISIHPPPAG